MKSEPPNSRAPRPGKRGDSRWPIGALVAGKYRLLRAVGHGGMGTVFKAENTAIGKVVAVKLLHANLRDDGVILQRFQREARTAVSVGHPNIVEVLDMGQEPSGAPFLVMEYVRGKSLKKILREEGPLAVPRALRVAGQVLDALGATHKRGVVHRDLKPENILLTPRYGEPDFVKVFDFGISTFVESAAEMERRIDLTPTGFTMATPFYASPEQVRGGKGRDPRVDIYAVGVILYEMLTGQRPFQGANLPDLCDRILSGEITPMRAFSKDVPEPLEDVVHKALASRPHERYQNATDMLWALVPFGANPPRNEEPEPTDTFTGDLRELRAREERVLEIVARSSAPPPMPPPLPRIEQQKNSVRSELVRGLVDHFEQRFGLAPVRALENTFGESVRRDLAVRTTDRAWCGMTALAFSLDRFDQVFGSGDRSEIAAAGRHFVRVHYFVGDRAQQLKGTTPALFFSKAAELWNQLVSSGEAHVIKVGRGYGRMEVRGQTAPQLALSVAALGMVDGCLRLAGGHGVAVRLAQSAAVGDARDLFEATWTE